MDKASASNVGDPGSIPGSGRSPGEGNDNLLRYSCLENPRDGGAWWAAVYGVAQSWTRLKRLSSSSRSQMNSYGSFDNAYSNTLRASLVALTVKHLSAMRETGVGCLGGEDTLEKEMAPHCSMLAWKIPWTEEPGKLQSMGSQRVGHD